MYLHLKINNHWRASRVFPHGRAWSLGSFHKSENGISGFRAVASLGARGEWAFRRGKSALPLCQACGTDAAHVPAELQSSSKMSVLPRRDTFLGFPSGEQSGGPCCNCAFRPSTSAPLACPAFGVDTGHVLAELRSSSMVLWGALRARACGRFQMGRARACGKSQRAGRAAIGDSKGPGARLWEIPKGGARTCGQFRKAARAPMGDSKGHGARWWEIPKDRARSCVI